MDAYITLDIGGTNTRCAVYTNDETNAVRYEKIATHAEGQTPVERIVSLVGKNWPEELRVKGISAAAPGSVNINSGTVILAPNITGWENIELRNILTDVFKVEVYVNNDARLAALGEWKRGAGRGHENLLYFTISTGIGGGVIIQNKLLEGNEGIATELGHISLVDNGPLCGCGNHGHLEALASGTGIENFVKEKISNGTTTILNRESSAKEISKAAMEGDKLAISAFERAGYYLGKGIANYLHIFNPSCVIFGGGVTQSGDLLLHPFRKSLEEHILNINYLHNLEIKIAELGDDAGLIGALEYLKSKIS